MNIPFPIPLTPMLTRLQPDLPAGEGWLYEPKWDGFRALAVRDASRVVLWSRNGQPLERYFPELVGWLDEALPPSCVVDGEIIVEGPGGLDFDALLQRVHPAPSRIALLSRQTPASFVAFDLLALDGQDLKGLPLSERRRRLAQALRPHRRVTLTPQTDDPEVARRWFRDLERAGIEGVVAKRAEQVYLPGERAMVKVKHQRTADCVVGGFRPSVEGVGSLLMGLYRGGELRYVGHTTSLAVKERRALRGRLEPLVADSSFAPLYSPGGPSRWNRGRELAWTPVEPRLVCEVAYDKFEGERFRHAVRLLRWRDDKAPGECTFEQVAGGLESPERAGQAAPRPGA